MSMIAWCPQCCSEILPQNVTFDEQHDLCGSEIVWIDTDITLFEDDCYVEC